MVRAHVAFKQGPSMKTDGVKKVPRGKKFQGETYKGCIKFGSIFEKKTGRRDTPNSKCNSFY